MGAAGGDGGRHLFAAFEVQGRRQKTIALLGGRSRATERDPAGTTPRGVLEAGAAAQERPDDQPPADEGRGRVAGKAEEDAVRGPRGDDRLAGLDGDAVEQPACSTAIEGGLQFAMPVTFGFNVATVDPSVTPAIDRFADVAKKHYSNSLITIEGFADPAGSAAYNNALSKRRANEVKMYLETKGMNPANLRTVGYGETRLVVPGATKDEPGADQNRRHLVPDCAQITPREATFVREHDGDRL